MKKNEKIMIIILILLTIIIISIVFSYTKNQKEENVKNENGNENQINEEFVQVLEDGTKLNVSTKLSETKVFEGIQFANIQLTNKGNQTLLIANVTNNTTNDTEAKLINIIIYDKNGNQIAKLAGRISPLKSGQTMQFSTSTSLDLANAYDFKITKQ